MLSTPRPLIAEDAPTGADRPVTTRPVDAVLTHRDELQQIPIRAQPWTPRGAFSGLTCENVGVLLFRALIRRPLQAAVHLPQGRLITA
jgi:hypothetical protein